MAARRPQLSEREQLTLFRALPGDMRPRDAQDRLSLLVEVAANFTAGPVRIRVEAVPEHGMATIWDADVLIWAASQPVAARDRGLPTSRLIAATSHEILTFIGRGTSARDYLQQRRNLLEQRSADFFVLASTHAASKVDQCLAMTWFC